jgi:hypothetical protein
MGFPVKSGYNLNGNPTNDTTRDSLTTTRTNAGWRLGFAFTNYNLMFSGGRFGNEESAAYHRAGANGECALSSTFAVVSGPAFVFPLPETCG